jgi:lysophospholipase L1-like esterase
VLTDARHPILLGLGCSADDGAATLGRRRHGWLVHRILRLVIGNVVVTATILVALELLSRLIQPVAFPDPLITNSRPDWSATRQFDPILFWTLKPGLRAAGEQLTNSQGLRGEEIGPKPHDEFRILSLGESTTFAIMLPAEANYSAGLQRKLPRLDSKRVRVVNAGVPGYSLYQGVTYLTDRGDRLEPDGVLVYFGYNDFLATAYRTQRDAHRDDRAAGLTDRQVAARRRQPAFRLAYGLARVSNLARYLFVAPDRSAPVRQDPGVVRVPEVDRRYLLGQLLQYTSARRLNVAIIVPWYETFVDHIPLLRQFAAEHRVPIVDLPESLSRGPAADAGFFIDAIHPNAAGHELIADVLAERLAVLWAAGRPE